MCDLLSLRRQIFTVCGIRITKIYEYDIIHRHNKSLKGFVILHGCTFKNCFERKLQSVSKWSYIIVGNMRQKKSALYATRFSFISNAFFQLTLSVA